MNDIARWIAETDRDVSSKRLSGGDGRAAVLRRSYETSIEELWVACTAPASLEQWFLPASGDLRPGGMYQLDGNAGGDILDCVPLRLIRVTWVYGEGAPSEVVVHLSTAGDGGATLELEHAALVQGEDAVDFVLGVGPGWDPALVALDLYLRGTLPDGGSWEESPEGREVIERSIRAWAAVLEERGLASASTIAESADAALDFYLGSGASQGG